MTASIVEVIQHYQRSIDNSQDNEDRLLYCIKKLYKLPIKVEHLQETGVGKTVNSLRKFNGEIGVAAKSLVTKWKAMVAAEEEPMDTTPHLNDNETHDSHNDEDDEPSRRNRDVGDGGIADEDDENHNQNIAHEQHKPTSHTERDRLKEHSPKESSRKHSSSSSKHSEGKHKSTSSSSKDKEGHQHTSEGGGSSSSRSSKEREKEKTEHKSRDKPKDNDQEKSKERSEKNKEEKQKGEKHKSNKESKLDTASHKRNSGSSNISMSKSDDRHSSSSSKDKSEKDKDRKDKHKSSSKDKVRSKEDKLSSTSKEKHEHKSTSSSSSHKLLESSSGRKRCITSDTESNDFKSPEPKIAKLEKSVNSSSKHVEPSSPPQEEDEENSFDSSMGANFGDILGMLNAPSKKGKKSLKSSFSVGSSNNVKDSPKPSTSNAIATKSNGVKTSPTMYSPLANSKMSTSKPDLLAPTAKLAPLDPSIVLELPTISTNYKPMPLNLTVMDCVFNTSSSSSSRPARTLTDAEALHHGISSKTMRTKIYSGVKTGQIMQVPSLFDMCIRILQKNIDALEYTGGVPFEVLRPVLERATPQQLFIFEDFNPYLMEDSDVLWQTHVSRNYRTQKRIENESWREMFMRCQEDEDRRLSVLKNTIKQSQKVAAAPVRKTQLAFIDSMVKPPRNVMRKQEQYGTKSKLVATPAARVASLQSVTPNAAKTGDHRLKVAPVVRDHAQVASSSVRPKKAPLMQKTLAFIRGRLKR